MIDSILQSMRLPPAYAPAADSLRGRVILVTGSGQGLGHALALTCAAHGAQVVLHGKRQKKLEALFDRIVASGAPEPSIFPLDLARATDADFAAMAQALAAQFGRLDGIAHCAVHLDQLRPLDDETMERWSTMLRVNLIAAAAIDRACLPLLAHAGDASIVHTIESHAIAPAAFWGSFAIAKQALLTLTSIQAQEWALHRGLRVNALLPGPIASPQRARTHPAEDARTLRTAESVIDGYLYLLGAQAQGISGRLLDLTPG